MSFTRLLCWPILMDRFVFSLADSWETNASLLFGRFVNRQVGTKGDHRRNTQLNWHEIRSWDQVIQSHLAEAHGDNSIRCPNNLKFSEDVVRRMPQTFVSDNFFGRGKLNRFQIHWIYLTNTCHISGVFVRFLARLFAINKSWNPNKSPS